MGGVGCQCIYLRSDDIDAFMCGGVRFRCIYWRDDDIGAFMCEEQVYLDLPEV